MRIFLLILFTVVAMQDYAKASILQSGDSSEVTHYYKGRIDDLNDVTILLNKQADQYKATFTVLRSGIKASFKGLVRADKLYLYEKTVKDSLISIFVGSLKNQELEGQWITENSEKSARVYAVRTDKEWKMPTNCADNKWLKSFRGSILHKEASLTLQKLAENKISGTLFVQEDRRTYKITGDLENSTLGLNIKDERGAPVGKLTGTYNNQKNLTLEFSDNRRQKTFALFEQNKHYQYGCIEFADKNISYDATYPKLHHEKFNQWLENNIQNWLLQTRKKLQAMPDKAFCSAQSWCEIQSLTDDYISGIITYCSADSNVYETQSFNYSFVDSRPILLEDLLLQKKESATQLFSLRESNKEAMLKNAESECKDWLKKETFDQFVLQKEGISFVSNFNPIYGRFSATIPYEAFSDKLNKYFRQILVKSK